MWSYWVTTAHCLLVRSEVTWLPKVRRPQRVEPKSVLLKFQGLGFWSFSSPYDVIQLYDTIMCSLSDPLGYPFRCFWGCSAQGSRSRYSVVGNWSRVGKGFALFGCFATELAIRVPDQGDCWGQHLGWQESRTLSEASFMFYLSSFHKMCVCVCVLGSW